MEWNTAKKIWQHSTDNHLFVLWEPFLETWPTAGIMQNGQVFELPTPAHHTTDSESLSLPILRTPTASQGEGGALGEEEARKRGNTVGIRDQAMDLAKLNGAKVSRDEMNLFPTPVASEGTKAPAQQTSEEKSKTGQVWLSNIAKDLEPELLPTTRTSMANGPTKKEIAAGNPKSRIEVEVELGETNWGKFEPAIRRWEEVLGRPAPAPTKPDGKDGAHRLSSLFTEWLMGLEPGWITDVGLSRNDELKACGNGVVPQQAELALRILLEGVTLPPAGGGYDNVSNPNS